MRLIRALITRDRNGERAALARRMGVQGLIYDCRSWWSGQSKLGDYSYCFRPNGEKRDNLDPTQAHMDHVHIELNWPGARSARPSGAARLRRNAMQAVAHNPVPLEMKEIETDHRRVGSGRSKGMLRRGLMALSLAALVLGAAGLATAAMQSEKLGRLLCETTGGGRFVRIPEFRGEKIDRRLLDDVDYLQERFKIFVTDGYSLDPVHSSNGEHPIGLALDIVPDFDNGGNWKKITRLANWAEPKQDKPRAPFRWVGYNGDAGHGRGHHLHLSYTHSRTRYDKPARTIQSLKCPGSGAKDPGGAKPGAGSGTGSGGVGLTKKDLKRFERAHPETGGIGL